MHALILPRRYWRSFKGLLSISLDGIPEILLKYRFFKNKHIYLSQMNQSIFRKHCKAKLRVFHLTPICVDVTEISARPQENLHVKGIFRLLATQKNQRFLFGTWRHSENGAFWLCPPPRSQYGGKITSSRNAATVLYSHSNTDCIYAPLDGFMVTKELNHEHRNRSSKVQKANRRSLPAPDRPPSTGHQPLPALCTQLHTYN